MDEFLRQEKNNLLEAARREIAEYAAKEKTGEIETGHFLSPHFDSSNLAEEDLRLWPKIQKETLAEEEFEAYNAPFLQDDGSDRADIDPLRYDFLQFIRNKAAIIFLARQIAKESNTNRKNNA